MTNSVEVLVGIIGAGGFAREVMPVAQDFLAKSFAHVPEESVKVVFVETTPCAALLNGYEIMSEADFCTADVKNKFFNIAIGSSRHRKDIGDRLLAFDCEPISILAGSARIYDQNQIGDGATICDNVIITSNAQIGKFFQANIYSYVAHDCVLGDYVTFAPRVSCNGNVHIGDFAYIGTGAVIKQGANGKPTIIGEGATVGMGAVVTKDVPPYTTVVGNPARLLQKT
ncbi:acetyltransferase [Salipiger mangrovisoli]|uniref:Acetyltransferase n=1 Tax=Salipiger mangrovisoli TaxID=2865933 RepID=A0ABR9XBP2_9RHOB|nr:acetyltransferase [Salipiger mangrovisoli]MBE9640912.1 acetyltransferase [Salipiger mangrovisoli]